MNLTIGSGFEHLYCKAIPVIVVCNPISCVIIEYLGGTITPLTLFEQFRITLYCTRNLLTPMKNIFFLNLFGKNITYYASHIINSNM